MKCLAAFCQTKVFLIVLYVGYIVGFALFYTLYLSSGHFYFGNVQYERAFLDERYELWNDVSSNVEVVPGQETSFQRVIENINDSGVFPESIENLVVKTTLAERSNGAYSDIKVYYRLEYDAEQNQLEQKDCIGDESPFCERYAKTPAEHDFFTYGQIWFEFDCWLVIFRGQVEGESSCSPRTQDPVQLLGGVLIEKISPMIKYNRQLASRIQAYQRSELEMQEGRFMRFLYFSAVTTTTLGYGDIAPISNAARMTITVQTIFGLILMGWIIHRLTKS